MIPRSVALDLRTATFSDGCVMLFEFYETNDDHIVFELKQHGNFGLSFSTPSRDDTHVEVQNNAHIWESGRCKYSIARCIVVFVHLVRKRFPWVQTFLYKDKAPYNIDRDSFVTAAHPRGDFSEVHVTNTVKEELYRVRYYENMGFEFDPTYDEILSGIVDEFTTLKRKAPDMNGDLDFEGDLLRVATTIDQSYRYHWQLEHVQTGRATKRRRER